MPTPSSIVDRTAIILLEQLGIGRAKDLEARGLTSGQIASMRARGVIERVGRGLYRLPDSELTEHHGLALAARKAPAAVVCLLSALRFHDLTSQAAYEVWLAIERDARAPKMDYPPLRITRMSAATILFGIEKHVVEGVPVRVFSAAKTVADCFKFRNRLGLEVAIEALRDFRRKRNSSMDDLWNAAGACRVQRVMLPYMEAIV